MSAKKISKKNVTHSPIYNFKMYTETADNLKCVILDRVTTYIQFHPHMTV